MARVTKAMLEEDKRHLQRILTIKEVEIDKLKFKIKVLVDSAQIMHTIAMVIALEKTTEAVAYVLSDLKRRTP